MNKTLATIFENKKLWALIGVMALLIVIGIANIMGSKQGSLSVGNEVEEERREIKNNRVIYLRNQALVKINFLEQYEECYNPASNISRVCSETSRTVVSHDYLNPEAEEAYKDIEVADNADLTATILLFMKTAKTKNLDFKYTELIADWDSLNDYKELIINDEEYDKSMPVVATFMESISEENLLEEKEARMFTVTFDSKGGSKVNSQAILEHGRVNPPKNPTRKNYEFVEWQLNGQKYDFQKEVLEDLTLVAVWKESAITTTEASTNPEPTTSTTEPQEKPASSIDNINLNENIQVQEVTESHNGYLFGSNVGELFASYLNNHTLNRNNLDDETYNSLFNQIIFTEEAYNTLKNNFAKLTSTRGIKTFSYEIKDHLISYTYTYLAIKDSSALKDSLTSISSSLKNDIKTSLSNAYDFGSSKTDNGSYKVLDENICSEYHLSCNRW